MFSDLSSYYHRWYHSRPVAITGERNRELHRMHAVLMKCIGYFVQEYRSLVPKYMPLGDKEMAILEEQCRYPFRAGTFRPDYIVSADGRLLLCEITSRFFAHGIFMSWFATQWSARFAEREQPADPSPERAFGEMMDYMLRMAGDSRRMFVLKSSDKTSEIRLYKRFYESHGIEVNVLEAAEVEDRRGEWDRPGTFIVSALNQRDILNLRMDTLKAMMARGTVSDFRNIFLVHDKRFMHLWFQDEFTSACLTPEETEFLRSHAIPTYLTPPPDARADKDGYILKPCRLGKSEGVHAGPLCTEEEWTALFDSGAARDMVCQPFIKQRTVHTVWEDTPFDDYICGMMLCVDDHLFDAGYFRCSSLPVTNVGDDRKAAVLYTDDPALLKLCDVL